MKLDQKKINNKVPAQIEVISLLWVGRDSTNFWKNKHPFLDEPQCALKILRFKLKCGVMHINSI